MCRESDASIAVMVFLSPRTHIPMDLSIKVMFAINSLCHGTGVYYWFFRNRLCTANGKSGLCDK